MKTRLRNLLPENMVARTRSLLSGRAFKGFSHVLTGNMLVTLSQGMQFLLLARALGPVEFGLIAGVASVTTVLMPFSGMGSANVMVMRAVRNPTLLPLYFGNALLNVAITSLLLTALAEFLITPFLGAKGSYVIMLVFCVAELTFSKFIDVCWQVFLSNERLHLTSIFQFVQSASKLLAVVIFMLLHFDRATTWAYLSLASNVAVAAFLVWLTIKKIGRPHFDVALAKREFPEGVPFAIGLSAKGFYTDADKIFLARYGAAPSVGMYTVAFRAIQLAMVPIRAVSYSTQARYYRAGGVSGVNGTVIVAKQMARLSLPVAALMGVAFYVTAPLITLVAGQKYAESAVALRWLCALPLFLAAQSLLGDTLTGSGNARVSASIQTASAVITCLLCIVLIPRFDWRGAAIASYLSQAFLVAMLLIGVLVLRRRPSKALP